MGDAKGYGTFLQEKVQQEVQQLRMKRRLKSSLLNTQEWMSKLSDETLLSDLSIPGTHDSAAYNSIWPFVSTQKMDLLSQLNAGIRYFDFRCGLKRDDLEMVHGTAVLGQKLTTVLEILYMFLKMHPTEALVVQVKQDRAPEDSTVKFPYALWTILDTKPQYWRTFPTTPKMAEVRGKIQLFRRFSGPPYRGIDVAKWQDNPPKPFTIHTWSHVQLTIQDHYNPADPKPLPEFIAVKGSDVSNMLERASADPNPAHWYINFASAYQINFYYQCTPKQIAMGGYYEFTWVTGINPRLGEWLRQRNADRESIAISLTKPKWLQRPRPRATDDRENGGGEGPKNGRARYGIIAMDFPDAVPDLIPTIIATNFEKKKKKEKGNRLFQPVYLMALFLLLVFVGGALLVLIHGPVDVPWCPRYLHACALRGWLSSTDGR